MEKIYTDEHVKFAHELDFIGVKHKIIKDEFYKKFGLIVPTNSLRMMLNRSCAAEMNRIEQLKQEIEIGSTVKIRWIGLGREETEVREGEVEYIHPLKRFVTVSVNGIRASRPYDEILEVVNDTKYR
jgi:hypothetical protein